MRDLWTEKYRPATIDGYVFRDQAQKEQVQEWISSGAIPHLLFSGVQGAGKTTLAKLLLNELGAHHFDVKMINASSNNGVDYIRDSVETFATVMGYGEFKYIILDEADYLSPNAQAALRGVMEKYSNSLRFILTCATGDTVIFTPEGTKRIDSVIPGTKVKSFDGYLENKFLKESIASKTLELHTLHGNKIEVTPDHKFFTLTGQVTASQLGVGSKLPLYVGQMYGNNFEHQDIDYASIQLKEKFQKWLVEKGVLTNELINWVHSNKKFVFNKTHRALFDYIISNNISKINLVELSEELSVSRTSVRNLLSKLNEYVTDKKYTSQSNFVYTLNLNAMRGDYDKFVNFVNRHNIDVSHLLKFTKNYQTVEQILAGIKFNLLDADLLLSLGRIAGFIEGDGHLSSTLHVSANNKDTLKKVHSDLNKITDVTFNVSSNSINSKGLCSYYNNKTLKLFLEFLGVTVGNKTVAKRQVPELCKYKLFFKGYLQGLYDADGKTIKILNDDVSVSPVLLTQSIASESQITFFEKISDLAKEHFGIDLSCKVVHSHESTFSGTDLEMHLYTGKSSQILAFLGAIGHYYDKRDNTDVYGYLMYKQANQGRPEKFSNWKDQYFGHGIINDTIVSIVKKTEQVKVYDCCFETNHWYITNGLMSHNCNYPNKIIPAIHSRCQGFHIQNLDKTEYTARMAEILIAEGVNFELEVLDTYVKSTYPDMRKCINLCQQNVKSGYLQEPNADDGAAESDYQLMMVALFKEKRYKEAREVICKQISPEEYEDLFRFMYQNLEFWAEGNEDKEDQCILVIRNGLVKHVSCADPEINISATLIELEQIANS